MAEFASLFSNPDKAAGALVPFYKDLGFNQIWGSLDPALAFRTFISNLRNSHHGVAPYWAPVDQESIRVTQWMAMWSGHAEGTFTLTDSSVGHMKKRTAWPDTQQNRALVEDWFPDWIKSERQLIGAEHDLPMVSPGVLDSRPKPRPEALPPTPLDPNSPGGGQSAFRHSWEMRPIACERCGREPIVSCILSR